MRRPVRRDRYRRQAGTMARVSRERLAMEPTRTRQRRCGRGHQPLGATWSAEATNFAVFSPDATAMSGLPLRRRRLRDPPPAHRAHPRRLARRDPRASGRASATASAPTGRGTRPGPAVQPAASCCSTPTRGRSPAGSTVATALFAHDRRRPPATEPGRLRAVRATLGGDPRRLRLAGATGRCVTAGATPSSTSCTSRASPSCTTEVPEAAARHVRRAGATPRSSATSATSASPPSSCCRCTSSSTSRRSPTAG